jgi:hypothetical protein
MQCLQIFCLKTGVSSGHFERRMAECLLKVEDASATSDVIQRERVPECVQASFWRIEAEAVAQLFDIPKDIAASLRNTQAGRGISLHDDCIFDCIIGLRLAERCHMRRVGVDSKMEGQGRRSVTCWKIGQIGQAIWRRGRDSNPRYRC